MKKLILLLAALLISAGAATAQSNLLQQLKNQAREAVKREVGKAVNNAKNGVYNNQNTSQRLTEQTQEVKPAGDKVVWTCPTCGKKDNEGSFCPNCGTTRPAGDAHEEHQEARPAPFEELPFVPGKTVIFEDTLSGETMDEAPSKWELLGASLYGCNVVRQAGEPAVRVKGFYSDLKPKMREDNYLPASFTVEMDLWGDENVNNAKTHALEVNFGSDEAIEEFSAIFRYGTEEEGSPSASLRYYEAGTTSSKTIDNGDRVKELVKPGAWNHAAVSYDHGELVLYVNGKSVLKTKVREQPTYLRLNSIATDGDSFTFKNFRIAAN